MSKCNQPVGFRITRMLTDSICPKSLPDHWVERAKERLVGGWGTTWSLYQLLDVVVLCVRLHTFENVGFETEFGKLR